VLLSDRAAQALREHRLAHPGGPDDDVFTAPKGGPVRLGNWRNRFWRSAVAKAGIKQGFTIHDCRHTAISLWIAAGTNIKQVSTYAGHESVAFTLDRYGHLYADDHDVFLLKLNSATARAISHDAEGMEEGHESKEPLAEIIPIRPDQGEE
jgi:integrase